MMVTMTEPVRPITDDEMTAEELAEWRKQFPGRDRPNVVTAHMESHIIVSGGEITTASDDPETED
jgi:hypothetical protein